MSGCKGHADTKQLRALRANRNLYLHNSGRKAIAAAKAYGFVVWAAVALANS